MRYTLKKEITLKTGTKFSTGTSLELRWLGESNCRSVEVIPDSGMAFRIPITRLPDYVSGFRKPSLATMEKWNDEGYSKTPTGKKTEPDGYACDNSPSWLLAFGVI